jgi:hypothetical protein
MDFLEQMAYNPNLWKEKTNESMENKQAKIFFVLVTH